MTQTSRPVAARVLRWARRVVAPTRKALANAAESRPPETVTLRAHDDDTRHDKRADSKLDALIFALGLMILADPYRPFVR